jgi:hypothetical protein
MLHTDLPIYRTGTKLLSVAIRVQQQMPRAVKRSLGDKVSGHCMEMLDLMALANATKGAERARYIQDLMKHLRATTVLLRVSHDSRYVPTGVWAEAVQLLDSIGRQGGGWLKSSTNRAPAA